ncbi:SDR family oxidoreductase [Vacuolonema iberomarrocanum]|uniref:SDR family oxidoreductase n=1 Tax=Vacuolonema iberomarrocanum TaxID=3454632 RepID=UPI001A0D6FCE|nr:SDR family oxidoreductase [filamentous cyanobacterium LEGE 07170]
MSRNRRQFLGAVGATGVVGAIGAERVMAQNTDSSTPTPVAQTTPTNRELTGKAAIVTGARANIGRAIAVELARMGSNVVIHYHRPETRDQAEQTAAMCQEYGVQTAFAVGDLGDKANVMSMFDVATDTFGRLDIFVHNAGALVKGPVAELSDEDYVRMQRVNVDATFYGFREAARRIEDGGRIIGIASSVTGGPPPQYGVYTGGKSFMNGMVLAMAKELGSRAITVNSINPGPLDTPFFHEPETPESVAYISQLAPMGRLGEVEELMPAVRMLLSPEGMWMNGETLYINNGYLQA